MGNFDPEMRLPQNLLQFISLVKIYLPNNIRISNFHLEIFSDASNSGWGVFCNQESTFGDWSEGESSHRLNYLALLGSFCGE